MGEYRVTEVKAAPGYQLLAESIQFSLPYGYNTDKAVWSYREAPVSISREITIADQPLYSMPSCGGGEAWVYISGFALCAAGIVMAGQRERKNRGETE